MLNDVTDEFINFKDDTISYYKKLVKSLCGSIIILGILAIVLWCWIAHLSLQVKTMENLVIEEQDLVSTEYSIGYWLINQPENVSDSSLLILFDDCGAWYPDILLKQAKLESANYTSNVFKQSNNLFGMKKATKRQNTQNGEYNGYASYNNWCLSALDRILWDVFVFHDEKPSREEYLKALSIYAEDPHYTEKLQ